MSAVFDLERGLSDTGGVLDAASECVLASERIGVDGSFQLQVPPEVCALRVTGGLTLRALEVRGGERLHTLDLSALADDLVLHVCGLPALQRLVLPTGAGCRVHVEMPSRPSLHIEGDLRWLDACWMESWGHRELNAAWNERSPSLRPSVLRGAWIGYGDQIPADVQFAHVLDAAGRSVDLSRAHKLAVLLSEHVFVIDRAGPTPRAVPIQDLRDHATQERARASVQPLKPSLEQVYVAVLSTLEAGERPADRELHEFAQIFGSHPLRAIEALAALPATVDPVLLWKLRRLLADAHLEHKHLRRTAWHWEFQTDQIDRVWTSDMRLWLRCRPHVAAAYSFERDVMRSSSDPDHLAAVARALIDPALASLVQPTMARGGPALDLLGLLGWQLENGLAKGTYFRRRKDRDRWQAGEHDRQRRKGPPCEYSTGSTPENLQAIGVVLRMLVRLHHDPATVPLRGLLVRWIRARLTDGSGVELLGAMHRLGSDAALSALAALIAEPAAPDRLRARAVTASLAPREGDYLS